MLHRIRVAVTNTWRRLRNKPTLEGVDALTDRQLVTAIQRQAISVHGLLQFALGETDGPRGMGRVKLKGAARKPVLLAKEDVEQVLGGLGARGTRLQKRPTKKGKRDK